MALLSWYKLDGDAIDSWGDSDGSVTGTVTYPDCVIEEGMHVTGQANNRIDVMVSPYTTQKSFSIACWVYIPSSYTWNTLSTNGVVAAGSYAGGHGLVRQANVDNSIGMYVRTTTQTRLAVTPITRDTWYHIVGVFNAINQELKIYKNGVLIDTTATTFPNESLDASVFILGGGVTLGGNPDPNRYFEGDIDDVRFYDHALSGKEAFKLSQAKMLHLKLDGDATDCSMFGHDGVVNGGGWETDTRIGSGSWYTDTATDDVVTTCYPNSQNVTYSFWFKSEIGSSSHAILGHRNTDNGFMFYRNSGNTVMQYHALKYYTDTTPASASVLKSKTFVVNTWYHVVCAYDEDGNYKIFYDGVSTHTGTATDFDYWDDGSVPFTLGESGNGGYTDNDCFIDDVQVFQKYLSDTECIALYEERASLDNKGNFHGVQFVETKYQPLLMNWTVWEDGQTGTVGDFNRIGDTEESERNYGTDPFGITIPIWVAIPDIDDDADGGWTYTESTADKTICYRYSVWMKRTGTSEGSNYLGCKHSHVINIVTDVVDANPYFFAGNPPNYTDWFLYVGHIREHDTIETTFHPDTGIWDTNGDLAASIHRDYKWIDGTVAHKHRSFFYYCTTISNRVYFAYPRVDVCDGTEPTLADLIGGLDGRYFDYVRSLDGTTAQPMSITSSQVLISNMSEVGPTAGLVGYWRLDGNAEDCSGSGNDGTLTGGTEVIGIRNLAYDFNGSGDKILVGNVSELNLEQKLTLTAWIKATNDAGQHTVASRGYAYMINAPYNNLIEFYANDGVDATSDSVAWGYDGEWIHVALVVRPYTDGWTLNGYVNGDLVATDTDVNFDGPRDTSETFGIGSLGGGASRYFDGSIDEVRVYDRNLSAEEIKILYDLGIGTGRMKLTTNVLYIKEKFNEV